MKLKLKVFNNSNQFIKNYGNLLNKSLSNNIFGSPYFFEYHKNLECYYLAIEMSNKLIAYLPYSQNKNTFYSHQGATYGGFIQLDYLGNVEIEKVFNETVLFLSNMKIQDLIIRFLPEVFARKSFNNLNSFFKSKMNLLYSEEEYFIKLNDNIQEINLTNFRRNHKREIKSFSNTNFQIIESNNHENIKIFYSIMSENLKKHNVLPTHSLPELEWLLKNLENDFKLTLIKNLNSYLSGIVKISINENTDYILYGSLNYKEISNGSLKYLYWHTAKQSFLNGKNYLTFGINNKHYEKKNSSLDLFKLGFGCNITNRETYIINI